MAERYARYGLKGNPFIPRPLNPRENPEDSNQIARLVKFHLDDTDGTLQAKIKAGEPAFFLISGKDGTGRTSIANYILTTYCQSAGYNQLIFPEIEKLNHNADDVYRDWMLRLLTALDRADIDIGSELYNNISNQVTLQNTPPSLLNSKFQSLVIKLTRAMDPLHACLGIYLENIPTLELFDTARDIFRYSHAICVMTISESVLAGLQKKVQGDHTHIVLEEIEGADVWEVIEKRWTGYPPNPFNKNGVIKAFSQRVPIARAIVLTGKLLMNMLDFNPQGNEWPHAKELEFHEDLIINQINTQSTPEWGHRGAQ